MTNCEFCGSPAHVWFNCPKKPDGWKPDRLKKGATSAVTPEQIRPAQRVRGPEKSTAALMEVRSAGEGALSQLPTEEAKAAESGNQAPPVDTSKCKDVRSGDRHRPGYWAEYMRNRRAKQREQKG